MDTSPATRPGRGLQPPRARWIALALLLVAGSMSLSACDRPPVGAPPVPTGSYTPYTPTPPRAVDLRTASQALSLQISAHGVPVDGLDCRPSGTKQSALDLHCVVTTGGEGHPNQIAEATWDRTAGTVHLVSVAPAPLTPRPPTATASVAGPEDADLAAARVTRAVRAALVDAGAVTEAEAAGLTCSDLHAALAGCEVHAEGEPVTYFNVTRTGSTLGIYPASG